MDFIKPQKSTGSLAALDDFTSDKYQDFIRLALIEDESATRTEPFPRMLINPYNVTILLTNILNLLVEYYENLYNDYRFISISSMINPSNNNIVVNSNIKQYGRLKIGVDIYGSIQAARHEKSSYILARFVQDNGTVNTYPGQVQFFFEHTVYKLQSLVYLLALVR